MSVRRFFSRPSGVVLLSIGLSGPFPAVQSFGRTAPDPVLDRIVRPLLGAVDRGLSQLRVLQRGPVQMYLVYVLVSLVVVLLVAR